MINEEDVIIPPVHSKEKQKRLEEGFIKAEELPTFEEHEFKTTTTAQATVTTKTKSEEQKVHYSQLPFDIVHKVIRATCIIAMLLWFVLIIFMSIITESNPFFTLVGLSPVLLTIIVTYILVDKYHLESGFLMVFPFIFTGVLLVLGFANMLGGMDYMLLASVNIIFGILFEAIITVHYSILRRRKKIKSKEAKEEIKQEKKQEITQEVNQEKKIIVKLDDDESLKSFVSSIEDKAKAINAVIGRVYSVKHGGTEFLRKKIKIDAENYNEINELKSQPLDKRRILAIELLRKIKDKLDLFMKPEDEVFEKGEMKSLVNIERDVNGNDKIMDVLIRNDKDPVKSYYDGAVEFCDNALDELVANELEAMKEKAAERKHRTIERAKKAIEEAKKKD